MASTSSNIVLVTSKKIEVAGQDVASVLVSSDQAL